MSDYKDDKLYVLQHLDRRTLLEQLAEEAAELSQTALKAIRAEELSNNPTPTNASIAREQLNEEANDVVMLLEPLGIQISEIHVGLKWYRWADRLRAKQEKKGNNDAV